MPTLNHVATTFSALKHSTRAVKNVTIQHVCRRNASVSFDALCNLGADTKVKLSLFYTSYGVRCNVFERYKDDLMWAHMDQIDIIGAYDEATIKNMVRDALWYCG